MNITIRELIESDDEQANHLLNLAFHSSTNRLNDLHLYQKLQPDRWFTACIDGRLIGTVGAINYGAFAYIGFMTVHPELQGQGIGKLLMEHVLSWLENQSVPAVMLDATKSGFPLYKKLGFKTLDETSIFEIPGIDAKYEMPSSVQPITFNDLDELVQLDTPVFGADRRKVFHNLETLYPSRAFLHRDEKGKITGYLFAQNNRIGPWVMLDPGYEEELLKAALTLAFVNPVSACVPSTNTQAIDLLESYGFKKARAANHMIKGQGTVQCKRENVFAQTSFGAG
ncbi:MAG: hypothetical protein CVU45_08500 [Chloroflexi bacterium HGW-Chloroflexi-7]|nr:MAG: hypothetical protein CVU45_08500 [Chloroflexi bacterium HGW-Chloroflexi-7]